MRRGLVRQGRAWQARRGAARQGGYGRAGHGMARHGNEAALNGPPLFRKTMTLEKRKPYRNRAYLDAIAGLPCVMCGADDGTIVPAHYSGKYSMELGKGWGQKADDHCVAALCKRCHDAVDNYRDGNDDARAIKFMLAILETQRRLWMAGKLRVL